MRGKKAKKRILRADIRYNSEVVSKLINYIMLDGKKTVARENVYGALEIAGKELNKKPMEAFELALENIKPKTEIRSRRVGGANYQVPVPVRDDRQLTLALRWLIKGARDSRGKASFAEALARELVLATKKEGYAFKKKEDVHKMAEANRAFAHFSW